MMTGFGIYHLIRNMVSGIYSRNYYKIWKKKMSKV